MLAKLSLAVVLSAASFMLWIAAASAGSVSPAPPAASPLPVIQVAGGCGGGWHRNRWDRCVRNRPVVRACPVGFHLNRWGACVRNRPVYRVCGPRYHLNRWGRCVHN